MLALISGASSGIGYEFAKEIDKLGYDEIWLIARRRDRLVELKNKLKTRAKVLALDLCVDKSFEIIDHMLEKSGQKISLLINSAGIGISKPYKDVDLSYDIKTINLNIKALTSLSKICLRYFAKEGIILNIASSAAFFPQPNFAIYSASKAFVLSYSRAIRREFKDIRVSVLCPNRVDTEFFEKSAEKSIKDLGEENVKILVKKAIKNMGKKDIITTHPLAKILLFGSKLLPHSLIMFIEKILGMY